MPRLKNSLLLVLLLVLIGAERVAAQYCQETDVLPELDGNNINDPGVTSRYQGGKVLQSEFDRCDADGRTVTEYFCDSSGGISSRIAPCVTGCLDGACVRPGPDQNGCFWIIKLDAIPNRTNSGGLILKVTSFESAVDQLFWTAPRSAADRDGRALEILVQDGRGATIATQYEDIGPVYYDVADRERLSMIGSRIFLPFDARAKALTFRASGGTVTYKLPASALRCGRPCLPEGYAGEEGIDNCCPRLKKRSLNPAAFVCVASEFGGGDSTTTR